MQGGRKNLAYQASRLRAFGKRSAPPWVKARIWNWEFSSGKWDHLEGGVEPNPFYAFVARSAGAGRLLDIACGTGVVRCMVEPGVLSRYVGVDISAAAIRRAEHLTADLESLHLGQSFVVGTVTDPAVMSKIAEKFDLVVFKECIYYVDLGAVSAVLRDVSRLVVDGGRVLFQIHDRVRWAQHVTLIRENLCVVEEFEAPDNRSILILAASVRPEPVESTSHAVD